MRLIAAFALGVAALSLIISVWVIHNASVETFYLCPKVPREKGLWHV